MGNIESYPDESGVEVGVEVGDNVGMRTALHHEDLHGDRLAVVLCQNHLLDGNLCRRNYMKNDMRKEVGEG